MNKLVAIVGLVLFSTSALAERVIAPNVTQRISSMERQYGTGYIRMVMPGVLYRGGTTAGTEKARVPLTASSAKALCEDGFDAVVYGYGTNWKGGSGQTINCSTGQTTYVSKRWDHPNEIHDMMKELYNIINEGRGAMYVHCWYGVHASGTLAATALRQFCGLSGDQAVSYWKSTVPASSLWYPNVIAAIKNFKPDPALNISAEQQQRVCPQL